MLSFLKESHPSITESEGDHPFVECATFADEIKGEGYSWQSEWHYDNQPYMIEGGSPSDYPDFNPPTENVTGALAAMFGMLTGDSSVQSTPYYQQIAKSFPDSNDQLSFALRLLIHYTGDIHQPLHTVAGLDSEYPKGDEGGNYEHVSPTVDSVSNLHSVWDSVIYNYCGYPTLVSALFLTH